MIIGQPGPQQGEQAERPDGLREKAIGGVEIARILEAHYGIKIRVLTPLFAVKGEAGFVQVTLGGLSFLWDPDPVAEAENLLAEATEERVADGGGKG